MKIVTDLGQSKKLAEILPLKSADMHWQYIEEDNGQLQWFCFPKDFSINQNNTVLAWSLAALLNILDFPALTQEDENEWEVCVQDYNNDEYIEVTASDPVDACVEMIIKLYEKKLL